MTMSSPSGALYGTHLRQTARRPLVAGLEADVGV